MRVTLTRTEVDDCKRLATERERNNNRQGRPNLQVDKSKPNNAITLQGCLGEAAFCKRYNI